MVSFQTAEGDFKPKQVGRLRKWLAALAQAKGFRLGDVSYVFGTDDWLLEYNRQFLDHDFLTDIITFDQRDDPADARIDADILLSVDRVEDNAKTHQVSFEEEFRRVLAHGLLHLCGYGDKTDAEAAAMRKEEEAALKLWEEVS